MDESNFLVTCNVEIPRTRLRIASLIEASRFRFFSSKSTCVANSGSMIEIIKLDAPAKQDASYSTVKTEDIIKLFSILKEIRYKRKITNIPEITEWYCTFLVVIVLSDESYSSKNNLRSWLLEQTEISLLQLVPGLKEHEKSLASI